MKILPKFVKNFGTREGHLIEAIVIHIAEGSAQAVLSTFQNEPRSSHYLILRDGGVWQFVSEDKAAWHAGLVKRPTAKIILNHYQPNPYVNPNYYTIGIEHEGYGYLDITAAQYATSAQLVKEICMRYCLPIDADHIIPHHSIRADKTCPGKIDMDKLINLAKGIHEEMSLHPAEPSTLFILHRSPSILDNFKQWLKR